VLIERQADRPSRLEPTREVKAEEKPENVAAPMSDSDRYAAEVVPAAWRNGSLRGRHREITALTDLPATRRRLTHVSIGYKTIDEKGARRIQEL